MSFVYIASPYSHPDQVVRHDRFLAVEKYTAELVSAGVVAYSPIVHSHLLAERHTLPTDFEFWQAQCLPMLAKASVMHVLCMDGWKESTGVRAEIEFAERCGINVILIEVGRK